MKPDDLNHEFTPEALRAINAKISACFDSQSDKDTDQESTPDFQQFNSLVSERDTIVQSVLSTADEQFVRQFAEQELKVNQYLVDMAQTLLSSAKDDVSHFIRSQAAIKKYK